VWLGEAEQSRQSVQWKSMTLDVGKDTEVRDSNLVRPMVSISEPSRRDRRAAAEPSLFQGCLRNLPRFLRAPAAAIDSRARVLSVVSTVPQARLRSENRRIMIIIALNRAR
jgi:hypothetical protein